MNEKLKKRLIPVTGIIVIVLTLVLAFVGASTSSKSVSVGDAINAIQSGQKIQVSGNVVPNSYTTNGSTLTFQIYDPSNIEAGNLEVIYDGAASSTFGNDVTAICTGKIDESGILRCTELITKCPSKYESASNALTVPELMNYNGDIYDKTVKVSGIVLENTLKPAGSGERFVIAQSAGPAVAEDDPDNLPLKIYFDGALSPDITAGSKVVVTGSLNKDNYFDATDVALEG